MGDDTVNGCELLLEDLDNLQTVIEFNNLGAGHLLQQNSSFFQEDSRLINDIEAKKIPIELTKFIKWQLGSVNNSKCENIAFDCGAQKSNVKREIEDVIRDRLNSKWVTDCAVAVSGELFMNAFYDAPRESDKEPGAKAEMAIAYTDESLILICKDPYGSLCSQKFFKRLEEVYKKGAGQAIRMNGAGAGIGCQIIFENCSTLMQFVWPEIQTIVVAKIPLNIPYRRFSEQPKNIIIYRDGDS